MDIEELTALKDGCFELDCVRMSLTKCDGSKTHNGPGYIRQGDDGQFHFRLFVAEQLDFGSLFQGRETKAGELLREKHSWTLEAVDTRGRTWTSDRIWNPDRGGHVNKPGFVVGGKCDDLTSQDDVQHETRYVSIEMLTFQKFKFPYNQHSTTTEAFGQNKPRQSFRLNGVEFACCGFNFSFQDEEELIRVKAYSDTTSLHPHFPRRITEAILFSFGLEIPWCITTRCENGFIKTNISANNRKKQLFPRPPLACRFIDTKEIWIQFELYLKYIIGQETFEFHPLTAQLHAIYASRKSSGQVQALATSVAVESILIQFFKHVGMPSHEQIEQVDAAIAHMQTWTNGSMKARACRVLENLKQSRAIDKLHALVECNVVNRLNVAIWKRRRDSIAHGNWAGDFQDLVDDAGSILVLLYQLIFHLIGYKGKQTDWGTHDWPSVDYPPSGPTALES